MSTSRRGYVWLWPGMVAVALVVILALKASSLGLGASDIGFALLAILIAALGSAIAAYRPGNRVAWLLRATSVVIVLVTASSLVAEADQPPFSVYLWNYLAVVVYNTLIEVALYPMLMILFIFPDGRYLSRRWRWAGWLAVVTATAMLFTAALSENVGRIYDPDGEFWNLPNPIGFLPVGAGELMVSQAVTVTIILALGGIVAMVLRYRRSELVVREQVKWVAYASGLAGGALLLMTTGSSSEIVWSVVPMIALAAIPGAITVAITRYRLFEIDRLISRTISYAIVIGLLAAAFFGIVTLVTAVLPAQDSLVVAGSTLAVAALFNPLRKRIQRAVDRRFNRSSYQAEVISEAFAAKLRESLTTEELVEAWSQTVNESFQPELTGIWLNENLTTTPKPNRP